MPKIYLASKSPRRKELLKKILKNFTTRAIELEEEILDGEHPAQTVKRLALHKMEAAKKKIKDGIIITADTIVVLDKVVLGKPKNEKDAEKMLKALSGKKHLVYTGYSVWNSENKKTIVEFEKTEVKFRNLGTDEIISYIETGQPLDKAGAYGIQDDKGALFVEKINGCYYNVMGLPVTRVYQSLKDIL